VDRLAGTGLVCDVGTDVGLPTVALRADLDALPLPDESGDPWAAPGEVSHACGHDLHATAVLGAGLALADLDRAGLLPGRVRLIFQPAEEVMPGGALDVIAAGATDGLQHVFAFHCDPRLEVGRIGLREGAITAGADGIKVTLSGPGGHTARPHLTADLVYALGFLVTELPGALSRLTDPRAGLSVVWGQVHAGSAANAIPSSGFVEGTVRCLDADVWLAAHDVVPDLIRSLLRPFGVDVSIDANPSIPPCVNAPSAIALARSAALEVVGEAGVVSTEQSLGGEDFAWIANTAPSALLRLGVRGPHLVEAGDLHQGGFDIDESALSIGVRVFARLGSGTSG
jgi:amidohydrolase